MMIFLGRILFIAAWLFPFLGKAPDNMLLAASNHPPLYLYQFLLAIPQYVEAIELRGSIFATAAEFVAFLFNTACILIALATGLFAFIFNIKNQPKNALGFSAIAVLLSLGYLLVCLEYDETPFLLYRAFGIGYIFFLCGNIMFLIGHQFAKNGHDITNTSISLNGDEQPFERHQYHYATTDHKTKQEISELYNYLNHCDGWLNTQQLQFINIKILGLTEKYLDNVLNDRISHIYMESKSFWENLNQDWERLNHIKYTAWHLHDELFAYNLNSIDEIVLRLLITTTYHDTEKGSMEDTIEFVEHLIEQAKELGD